MNNKLKLTRFLVEYAQVRFPNFPIEDKEFSLPKHFDGTHQFYFHRTKPNVLALRIVLESKYDKVRIKKRGFGLKASIVGIFEMSGSKVRTKSAERLVMKKGVPDLFHHLETSLKPIWSSSIIRGMKFPKLEIASFSTSNIRAST